MTEFDQSRIAHLQMIQAVVTRMAGNSFALKTGAVTLTTGIVALLGAIKEPGGLYVAAGVLPIAAFWWLDAKYLQLERLYRRLYDDVRRGTMSDPFGMDTRPYKPEVAGVGRIAWSWSVAGIYVALLVVLAVVGVTMAGFGR